MFDFLKQQPIPDNFDYKRKKREIGQKAEVANQLRGFRPSELQFLPGGYTAGGMTNPLSTIATIAANVAGAKLLANSQKEMDALDDAGDKLYRQGIQALKDVRDDPTGEQKKAAQDVRDLSYFAEDPLLPYDIKDKTPAPVAQTSPVDAPATVEAKPLEPVKTPTPTRSRTLPKASTGSGRGGQGGPTADELAANNASKIDAENLQSPMQVFKQGQRQTPYEQGQTSALANPYKAGQAAGNPYALGQAAGNPYELGQQFFAGPARENMGIDKIGVSQMTPQQIERAAAATAATAATANPNRVLSPEETTQRAAARVAAQTATTAEQQRKYDEVRQQVARDAERQAEVDRQVELDALGQQYRADNQQELADFKSRKGKVLAKSIQDRTEEAKSMLSRSGERGQKLVDAMDTAYVNNLLSPEDDRKNYIAVGDRLFNARTRQFVNDGKPQVFKEGDYIAGAGGLVRVGGGAGSKIKETKDTPAGILAIYEDGSTKILNPNSNAAKEATQAEADKALGSEKKREIANGISNMVKEVIASGDVELAGAGMMNSASGFLNKTLGVNTKTAEARSRIDALKARMVEYVLNKFADTGMSPNKLADTKRELELHVASMGNFDWERLGPDALKVELEKVGRQMAYVATNNPYKAAGIGSDTPTPVNTPRAPSGRAWER